MQVTQLSLYQRFLQSFLMRVRPNVLAAKLKLWLGVKRFNVKTNEGTFWIDPVSLLGVALTRRGQHEEGMIQTLRQHLKLGSCFVDLGANEGYFTIIGAGICGSDGCVVSIEPQKRLLPVIAENVRLNNSPKVTMVNAAVGDAPGVVVMQLSASTNTGGSGFGRSTSFKLPTQEVEMMTLKQLFDQYGVKHVDLMKVDIEGFEYEALLGSREIFATRKIKALALELHPTLLEKRGRNSCDIEMMLQNYGYRKEEAFGNTVWFAPE